MAKRGTLEHPKTKRLARILSLPSWAALGLLESFWHWVGRYCPTGELTDEDLLDCQDTVRFDGSLKDVLIQSGWLDLIDDSTCYVHDWHDHADDTVKKTLQKRKEQFANGANVRNQNDSRPIRDSFANDSRHAVAMSHEPEPKPQPNAQGVAVQVWNEFAKTPAFANGLTVAQVEGLEKVCAEFNHIGDDKLISAAAACSEWYRTKPKWGGKDTVHSESAPTKFRDWLKRESGKVKPDTSPARKRPPRIDVAS